MAPGVELPEVEVAFGRLALSVSPGSGGRILCRGGHHDQAGDPVLTEAPRQLPLPSSGLVDSTLLLLGGDHPLLVPFALGHPPGGPGIPDLGEGLLGGDGLEVHGQRPHRSRHCRGQ